MIKDEVIALARKAGILEPVEMLESNPWRQDLVRELTLFSTLIEAKLMERLLAGAGEPVAEVYRHGKDSAGREWHGIHWYDPNVDTPSGTKIYTADQLAAAVLRERESRKPLTDEQISDLAEPFGSFEYGDAQGHKRLAFARAIEAAHGIGDKA